MMLADAAPSPWARTLGWAGLLPFVSLAAALVLMSPVYMPWVALALLGYSVTIASFLGAIHWGLAMREGPRQPLPVLLWGVAPSLVGWMALLFGQATGLLIVAGLLWACYLVDSRLYPRYRLNAWLPMRLQLTLVASASCVLGASALIRNGAY